MTISHDTTTNIIIATCDAEEMHCIYDAGLPIDTERAKRGRGIIEFLADEKLLIEESTGKRLEMRVVKANGKEQRPAAKEIEP